MNQRFLLLILSFFIASACRELVELDLPKQEPMLVIEGELSDTLSPHEIRITLTQDYFSKDPAPVVEDAVVRISDDAGNSEELRYAGDGFYKTEVLEGVIGRTYTLQVYWQGQEYESSGRLLPEPVIDSLVVRFRNATPPVFEEGYYIYVYGKISPEGTRQYRFKTYLNDSLFNDRTDLLIPDDRFFPENLRNLFLPYVFEPEDTVKLEMYTLNPDMYNYYVELRTLLFNDGGLFSPPPRNPTSNIRNLTNPKKPPLGYFQVASKESGRVVVKENR